MAKVIRNALFYCVIAAAPLAIGSVHVSVAAGLFAVLAFGVWGLEEFDVLGPTNDRSARRSSICSIPSLAFFVLAAVSLLQIVPVPGFVHSLLSPTGSEVFAEGWRALFGSTPEGTHWRSLSLARGETFGRGLQWLTLGVAAGLGSKWAPKTSGWMKIARVVVGAGLGVTAVGAVQSWAGAEKMLFFHESARMPGYSTFINANHAAGFAGLVSLVGFFLALQTRRPDPAHQFGGAAVGVGFMLLMFEFGSAGATIAFVVAVGFFAMLFTTTRAAGKLLSVDWARKIVLGLGATVLVVPVGAGIAVWLGPGRWRAWLWESPVGVWLREKLVVRLEMIRASLEASADYWLTGAGGGVTESVIPVYIDWSVIRPATIGTVENEPAEWLFHYGIPVGGVCIVAMGSLFWFLYRRYRRRRRFRYTAAFTVALYLGILAQFQFPFLVLGISVPAVVLIESLAFPMPSEDRELDSEASWSVSKEGVLMIGESERRLAWCAAVAAGIVFTAGHFTYRVEFSRSGLERGNDERIRSYEELVELVPAEGELYLDAAYSALEEEDRGAAIRRAKYAFEREPTANLGILVARIMVEADDREQAKALYTTIFGGDYTFLPLDWVRDYLVPDFHDPDQLAEILSEGDEFWNVAADELQKKAGPSTAVQFALRLHELRPESFEPNRLVVENYLEMEQYYLAEIWARELMEETAVTDSQRAKRAQLLVRVLRSQDKRREARRETVRALGREGVSSPKLARSAIELRRANPARAENIEARALAEARRVVCGEEGRAYRTACWSAEAWLEEYRENYPEADEVYKGVTETTDDPRIYADFLARRSRCEDLREFIGTWEFQSKQRRRKLEERAAECNPNPE